MNPVLKNVGMAAGKIVKPVRVTGCSKYRPPDEMSPV